MKRKNIFQALLIAGLLIGSPLAVDAAGLGKLRVISALGQPLRAEIDLIAVPKDEVDLITARIAPADAYKQARVERQEGLSNVRFAVAKRPNGEPYLLITSAQAFNEPFLDLLIQLDWPSGRLLREYTILLDPPGFQDKPVAPVVSAPLVRPEPAVRPSPVIVVERPAPKLEPEASAVPPARTDVIAKPEKPIKPQKITPELKVVEKPRGKKSKVIVAKAEPARPLTPAEQTFPRFDGDRELPPLSVVEGVSPITPAPVVTQRPEGGETKRVQRGETLRKIAQDLKPEGYSVEQMMAALYENNKSAFRGDNLHRIKTGSVLSVPDKAQLDSVDQADASKLVKAHAADWNAYRQKLAAKAAEQKPAPEAKPDATEKITAKVEDKVVKPQEPAKDVLKLSKGEAADKGKGTGAAGKGSAADTRALQDKLNAAQDDAVAKEKALREANSRVTDLEKNVKDMQGLLELKNKQLAELEKQAKTKPITPPVVAKVDPPKTESAKVEPPKPEIKPEPVKEAVAPATTDKAVEPLVKAVPEQTPPVQVAPSEAKPAEVKPVVPVKAKPVPQPEPETSFMDTLMSNPLYMGGAAAAVVGGLFAALWALGRRRKKSLASFEDSIMTGGSDLKTNTVFGNTAGGQIDTGDTSFLTDFSQAGMGAIDTNDVDPIAEAEVYMAYGRDAQAEEILKEAMSKDPNRHEIQLKLLEIYAGRKNNAAFETLAGELYAATSGQGPVWEKAAEFGRSLDAGNPLYAVPEGKSDGVNIAAAAAGGMAAGAALSASDTTELDFNLDLDTEGGGAKAMPKHLAAVPPAPVNEPLSDTLDFDLDTVTGPDHAHVGEIKDSAPMNFNLDTIIPQAIDKQAESPSPFAALDADTLTFDLPDMELDTPSPSMSPAAQQEENTLALDFDFNLDPEVAPAKPSVAAEPPMMPDLDLSGINLDFGGIGSSSPANEAGTGLEESTTMVNENTVWEEASTKLDLARAYLEMGDKEGAREILQEVVAEGGPEQQSDAKKLIATLS